VTVSFIFTISFYLLAGKSNKMIAHALGIAERTVEFHLKNIYAKYQVNSRMELALRLRESTVAGWVFYSVFLYIIEPPLERKPI